VTSGGVWCGDDSGRDDRGWNAASPSVTTSGDAGVDQRFGHPIPGGNLPIGEPFDHDSLDQHLGFAHPADTARRP